MSSRARRIEGLEAAARARWLAALEAELRQLTLGELIARRERIREQLRRLGHQPRGEGAGREK